MATPSIDVVHVASARNESNLFYIFFSFFLSFHVVVGCVYFVNFPVFSFFKKEIITGIYPRSLTSSSCEICGCNVITGKYANEPRHRDDWSSNMQISTRSWCFIWAQWRHKGWTWTESGSLKTINWAEVMQMSPSDVMRFLGIFDGRGTNIQMRKVRQGLMKINKIKKWLPMAPAVLGSSW